jgi:hypothetical protein
MIEPLIAGYTRNLDYARKLVADIPQDRMDAQPVAGKAMNHATWVLGHLARTTDGTAALFGLEPVTPPEWGDTFGNKSCPAPTGSPSPSKEALLAALEKGHERVVEALKKAGEAILVQPTPVERMRGRFPTIGEALMLYMSYHEAVHLGQLSAWRRAQGLPSV